jgi:hypothetical protein
MAIKKETKPTGKDKGKGAFAVDPKQTPEQQLAALDKRIKAGKATGAEKKQRNTLFNQVQSGSNAALAVDPQKQQYDGIINQAGGVQSQLLNQAQDRGEFNPQTMGIQQFQPGDFQQQFQGAYDAAMNQFNRSSQPAFEQQNKDYEQMAAERGWDPNSEVAKNRFKQIQDNQNNARLNAQDAAYQTGLGAQNQAYTQASNSYGQNLGAQGQQFGQQQTQFQMPFQNLSALSPYLQAQYGQQMGAQQQGYTEQNAATSQDYAKELAALQQRYTMQNAKFAVANRQGPSGGGGGGGGGGLTLADQIALQNNAFYNNMVLGGLNQPQSNVPNTGNAALQGFANGVGAGIGAGLAK